MAERKEEAGGGMHLSSHPPSALINESKEPAPNKLAS